MIPIELKESALSDYRSGDPLKNIAVRYGLLVGTISLWAKKAGYTRRSRGTRRKLLPTEQDMQIVAAVKAALGGMPTLAEIGVPYSYSRSAVHRIYHRWKDWKPVIPFRAGARIRFEGRDYQVTAPRVFDGDVIDLKTGQRTVIAWRKNSRVFAVRI
jgi:hypothetical protein